MDIGNHTMALDDGLHWNKILSNSWASKFNSCKLSMTICIIKFSKQLIIYFFWVQFNFKNKNEIK